MFVKFASNLKIIRQFVHKFVHKWMKQVTIKWIQQNVYGWDSQVTLYFNNILTPGLWLRKVIEFPSPCANALHTSKLFVSIQLLHNDFKRYLPFCMYQQPQNVTNNFFMSEMFNIFCFVWLLSLLTIICIPKIIQFWRTHIVFFIRN